MQGGPALSPVCAVHLSTLYAANYQLSTSTWLNCLLHLPPSALFIDRYQHVGGAGLARKQVVCAHSHQIRVLAVFA